MKTFVLTCAILLLAGCGSDIGHPDEEHDGCTFHYNDEFINADLILVHSDERDCPLDVNVGEGANTGGVIYDLAVEYPHGSSEDDRSHKMYVSVHDESSGATWPWEFSGLLGLREEYFAWGTPHDGGPGFEWQAAETVNYNAGQSPDFGLFQVEWWDIFLTWAEARMTISYWGTEM